MEKIYELIKKLRIEKGMTQSELAKKVGYADKGMISRVENGKVDLQQSQILKFAIALETTPSYLMGWGEKPHFELIQEGEDENKKNKKYLAVRDLTIREKTIPILGRVAAGIPINAIEEVIDYEEISESMAVTGEYFGLLIKGDSMEPRIKDHDVVIVRKQDDADDGDLVIALINGHDAVCKRLKKYKDGIALLSNNPAYEPLYFSNEEIQQKPVTIIGKVKELRAKF